jgi:hypothetical protein
MQRHMDEEKENQPTENIKKSKSTRRQKKETESIDSYIGVSIKVSDLPYCIDVSFILCPLIIETFLVFPRFPSIAKKMKACLSNNYRVDKNPCWHLL